MGVSNFPTKIIFALLQDVSTKELEGEVSVSTAESLIEMETTIQPGPTTIGRVRKPQQIAAISPWTAWRLALGLPLALLLLACCLPGDCLAPTQGPGRGRGELPPHAQRAREPRAGEAAGGVGCQGSEAGPLGADYTGTANTTVSGRTCQM